MHPTLINNMDILHSITAQDIRPIKLRLFDRIRPINIKNQTHKFICKRCEELLVPQNPVKMPLLLEVFPLPERDFYLCEYS